MQGNLWITLTPCPVADTYKPIDVITYEDKRFYYCNCKTLNLIPSCLAATGLATEQVVRKQFSTEEILLRSAHTLMFLFLRTVRLLLTSLTIWFFREQQRIKVLYSKSPDTMLKKEITLLMN